MNARSLAPAILIALLFTAPMARAQCPDWLAGPLDAGSAANGANGDVKCTTYWDPDGAGPQQPWLVIGGFFTSVEGVAANHVAMQDPVTGQWQAVGGGVGFGVYAMTVWNDMLVVAGNGDNDPGTPDNNILAFDGSSWSQNFYQGTSTGTIQALANYNGELYAGGPFVLYPGYGGTATNIAHWNVAHQLWEPVAGPGTNPGQVVECLTTWSGKLYAGTYYHDGIGNAKGDVWSFDGSNWSSLVTCDNAVTAFQPFNGELVVGGYFQVVGTSSLRVIMAYNGSIFHSYGAWTYGAINALTVWNSQLVAGGQFTAAGGNPANNIALLSGSTWTALDTGLDSYVWTLIVNGSDLLAGGHFVNAGGQPANHLARWSGYAWSPVGGGNVGGVLAMTPYFGRLVLGGGFHQSAEPYTPAHDVVGWNGSSLYPYGTGLDGQVNSLKSYNFGTIVNQTYELVAGGYFSHAGGVAASNVARYDQSSVIFNTPAWSAMGPGFDGGVLALERHNAGSGNNTYAGGVFVNTGGAAVNHVARWNSSSQLWESMAGGMNGVVYALKSYGGYLYAGGSFTTAGGVSTGGLARWNGSSWSNVGGFFNGTVYALEVYNGLLVMAGNFPGINSSPNIAYYNSSSSSYGTFSTGGTDNSVFALHAVGSRLYIGGSFSQAGGGGASHVAYWDGSWHPMTAGTDGIVYALGDIGSEVVAGGAFTVAGLQPVLSPHAARYSSNGLPWFEAQPYSQTVLRGASITLNAPPGGDYGATEHWTFDGLQLHDGTTPSGSSISGSSTSALTITGFSGFDAGDYRAALSTGCGTDSSSIATLTLDATAGVGEPSAFATVFDGLGPNPSHGASMLAFTLAREARVGLRVVDVAGRRVGGADFGRLAAGRHEAMWSARDAAGGSLRTGLYFATLEVDGRPLATRRMTIVR